MREDNLHHTELNVEVDAEEPSLPASESQNGPPEAGSALPDVTPNVAQVPPSIPTDSDPARTVTLVYQSSPSDTAEYFHVIVGLDGAPADVADVTSVTYYLHPTFEPSTITRTSAQNFILEFDTWGEFELSARIYFSDGSSLDQDVYIAH